MGRAHNRLGTTTRTKPASTSGSRRTSGRSRMCGTGSKQIRTCKTSWRRRVHATGAESERPVLSTSSDVHAAERRSTAAPSARERTGRRTSEVGLIAGCDDDALANGLLDPPNTDCGQEQRISSGTTAARDFLDSLDDDEFMRTLGFTFSTSGGGQPMRYRYGMPQPINISPQGHDSG